MADETRLTADEIRNRVKEVRRVRFGDVLAHPDNPRSHPDFQREVFRGAVRQVGFTSVPLAYASARNGGALTWLDGHLRGEEAPDFVGEVGVLDVTDEEADFIVLTLDPLAALALTLGDRTAALVGRTQAEDPAVRRFLDDLIADVEAGLPPHKAGGGGVEESDFWPVVRVAVPPDTLRHFESLMAQAPEAQDWAKFASLLSCVDTAALAALSEEAG